MSKLDVLKSLIRSAAGAANGQLTRSGLPKALKELASRRMVLPDAEMSSAVSRVAGVMACTVSTTEDGLHVDVGFEDGSHLAMALTPMPPRFAPRGAKEVGFRIRPAEAAQDLRAAEIVAAIASRVAIALWGPFFRRFGTAENSAYDHRDGDLISVDLRTVPAVRAAVNQPVGAAMIEGLGLLALLPSQGALKLKLGMVGLG